LSLDLFPCLDEDEEEEEEEEEDCSVPVEERKLR